MIWYIMVAVVALGVFLSLPLTVRLTFQGGVGDRNRLRVSLGMGRLPVVRVHFDLGTQLTGGGMPTVGKFRRSLRRTREGTGGILGPVLSRILPGVRCSYMVWRTQVGLGDAAATGIGSGMVWTAMEAMLPFLRRRLRFAAGQPRLAVEPSFREMIFATFLDCILSVKVGYLILAGFRILGDKIVKRG